MYLFEPKRVELRDYQKKLLCSLWTWWDKNTGNPCVVAPTGAGKTVLIAAFCKEAIKTPDTRILIITHVKELVEQDYEEFVEEAPDLNISLYCAGLKNKDLTGDIIFSSIQSIYRHSAELGMISLVVVDEAHLISHKDTGMYRTLIDELSNVNPALKVVGFTATPYRMSHGMITDEPAIFSEPLIDVVSIKELQEQGYLCPLVSKHTLCGYDLSGVKITAGEYNQKQLIAAVDTEGDNKAVVEETIRRAKDRRSWLIFCTSIEHAEHIRDLLLERGISAEAVSSKTPAKARDELLRRFRGHKLRALCNVSVLSTGYNNPSVDCIVMLRPTLSPGLYLQIVGRGLRVSPEKKDCLVLDFAGNIERHGTIHNVEPPMKKKKCKGVAPCKVCPVCDEIVPVITMKCPVCGYAWEKKEKKYQLSTLDINGETPCGSILAIGSWSFMQATSRAGNRMVRLTYYPKMLSKRPVYDYLMLWSDNSYVRNAALKKLDEFIQGNGLTREDIRTTDDLKKLFPPMAILTIRGGKGYDVVKRLFWNKTQLEDFLKEEERKSEVRQAYGNK